MKGMIFAAGLGSRLAPLTDNMPKALIEVGGCAMLERVILRLKEAGVDVLVINVHHHADQIEDFLNSNSNFGIEVHISDERQELLDTGGGIRRALPWLYGDGPVIVHNADIYTDLDLRELVEANTRSAADVTLLVSDRSTSRYLMFDDDNRMRGWHNTVSGEYRPERIAGQELHPLAFGGIHILSQRALVALQDYKPDTQNFSITPFYIDECDRLDIRGYQPAQPYHWFDIGRPETLRMAREYSQMIHDTAVI